MKTTHRLRACAAALCAIGLLLVVPAAEAGQVTLAWPAPTDAMTAGFELELLDANGDVVRAVDTGEETVVVIENLDDGVEHRFRVRPYDRFGRKAREASEPFSVMPEPVVTGISVTPRLDGDVDVTLSGLNFADGSRLELGRRGTRVVEMSVVGLGRITARLAGLDPSRPLAADELLVVPPVRKGQSFVLAHPALLDVDDSGHVSMADVALISDAFGAARGDWNYDARLDPNDDGVIDGEDRDLARVAAKSRGKRVIDGR